MIPLSDGVRTRRPPVDNMLIAAHVAARLLSRRLSPPSALIDRVA